jgi:pimeloyl-ACP methyl ester carboxylesterase
MLLRLSCSLFFLISSVAFAGEFTVQSDDVTLSVSTIGQSDNVLFLIGGGPGASSDHMKSLEALTNDQLMIVRFDLRGTGKSTEPKSEKAYTPADYVRDLEAVRVAIGAKKIHILGHSFGGLIALKYAVAYPGNISSLLLYGSAPSTISMLKTTSAGYTARYDGYVKLGILQPNAPEGSYEAARNLFAPYFADPNFKIPDELLNESFSEKVFERTINAFGKWDFKQEFKGLKLPILLIDGEMDPFEMGVQLTTRSLQSDLSNSKLNTQIIPKCGHFWQECLSESLKAMGDFLIGKKPRQVGAR